MTYCNENKTSVLGKGRVESVESFALYTEAAGCINWN